MSFHAVVLAAGFGSRFGGGKLLAPFKDGVLLDAALSSAFAAPVETVVVAHADPAVASAATTCTQRLGQAARLRVVRVPDAAEGMAASLRAGLAALPVDAQGVLVFLGDMPAIPPAVPPALIAALQAGAPAAVPVFEGRRGHPAAFAASLFPELMRLTGDQGARAVLAGLGARVASVPAPDGGILLDVDTADDLARLA